ncbi:hypothetical protein [Fusobacterium nucleatum]|uniref:hypothetical protein n=1 Tax=Fusobacterium nucleatum TaxID=851 RepID=UPI00235EC91C|nr:hypothetical protein [Fusobacterium nucleatum]WDA46841.1 hypothetical protein PSR67_04765 [Fusobacterium nucleatum]
MSYFEGLKLTKKGEQLQAKINGNLSETLTFTKAKLGSGSITSNDEIRFLTDVKEEWGTANVASCKIQGDENNIVAIELQFSNAGLREDKIFREIGLYARGNEGDEILYAYANAGDKYDYIPLMKDSPHSFVIVIYFNITSGTKVDANIDLYSYITLQKFNEEMRKKENIISKKSGFNLEKTDSFKEDDTNKLATAKALKSLHDEVDRKTGAIKLNWDSIKDKPSSFVPSEHNHNSLYYTETEVDEKLENNILYSTGKTYGGLLNEPGVKSAGKAYWDNNTKKLYICKNNNSDISPNVNNYIPFDSNSLLERLENLSKNTYIVLKNSSLRQALIETLNTNINLISMPEPNTIPELRDIIKENARVEAFKIINNNYGIRWLIWEGENLYYAFMWNSSTNLKITKIG